MLQVSLNLPTRHRLDMSLTKSRKNPKEKPLLPDLGEIRSAKKGNKLSLFFRHIFEHKKIKKLLGTNLALAVIASSLFPSRINFQDSFDVATIVAPELIFTTERPVRYPIEKIKITQGYKPFHPGLDFEGETGDSVYPVMAGEVEDISRSRVGYGNAVIVNHGGDMTSLYAHLSQIKVEKDQNVTTDTIIGEMGSSGTSSGDHLHLEIRESGSPVNPYSILPH